MCTLPRTLAQAFYGRGKKVEDISKEINEMFSLTEQQIKAVDEIVEAFIYGGGVQEKLPLSEKLEAGFEYILQKLWKTA